MACRFTTINTTAVPANSNSVSVGPVNFKMTRHAKKIIHAGLAIGLVSLAAMAQTATPLGGLPLFFEANHGQVGNSAQFLAHGRDSQFLISPTQAQIVLRKEAAEPAPVRMQF